MITKELAQKALSKLTTPAAYEYFFENLKSEEWIAVLKQVKPDIFKKPIQASRSDQGVAFPWWPESRYLARVAEKAPKEVTQIILELEPTDNSRVHDDLAEATLKIPLKDARRVAPKLISWLDNNHLSFLPESCAKLALKFSEAGDCDMAIEIMKKVLELRVIPKKLDSTGPFEKDKVVTRYFDYHYQEILKNIVPLISQKCGLPFIKVLDETLLFTLRTEGDLDSIDEDNSYIWRPAIEEHNQNHPESLKDHLIDATRDSYDLYITEKKSDGPDVINSLLQSHHAIHIRLGLYLLAKQQKEFLPLLENTLLDPKFYGQVSTWHEFSHLLENRFKELEEKHKQTIQNQILSLEAKEVGDEDSERYARKKKYRTLNMIAPYLSGQAITEFEGYKAEFGSMEHPDFHSYSHGVWVGPTSPKEDDELEKMSPEELLQYLLHWKPTKEWSAPSREGLARKLEVIIKNDPSKALVQHEKLKELNPTYLRTIFQALKDTEKDFDWEIVLDLCLWVSNQKSEPTKKALEDEDPGFQWAKTAIARLITKGFDSNKIQIPLREKAWQTILPITSDPDPDSDRESKFLDSDYYTYAMNTTRGEALEAVVSYGLWLKRKKKIPNTESVLKFAPEIQTVLDDHLDLSIDPQISIRAIYGRWLPWLVLFDKDWVKANIPRIFPQDVKFQRHRQASWDSYVTFCGAFKSVFEVIEGEYLAQIKLIPEHIAGKDEKQSYDPISRLGEHLMVFYGQGVLGSPTSSPHLVEFFKLAPINIRENAINFVGRSMKKNRKEKKDEIPGTVLERFQKLWEWRKNEKLEWVKGELSEFGWWVASDRFEAAWALTELEWVLKNTKCIEPETFLFDELQLYIGPHTPRLLSITRYFIEGPVKEGRIWLMKDRFSKFLSLLKKDLKDDQKKDFIELIDALVSAGYLDFRSLAQF